MDHLPFETLVWRRYVAAELAAKKVIVEQLWELPQDVIQAIAQDTEMGLVQAVALELLHGHVETFSRDGDRAGT